MLRLRDGDASFLLSRTEVMAKTAWSEATIPLSLGEEELPRLGLGLRRLAEVGSGSLIWANDRGEVRIEVAMAKRGETHWSVRLQAPPDFLHELRLVFVGGQDELPQIAESLLI